MLLSEQFGIPGEYKIERYVNPILRWMTEEWARIRQSIADLIIDAGRNPLSEQLLNEREVFFPQGKQNKVKQDIDVLMGSMAKELDGMIREQKQKAKIEASMPGLYDPNDMTPIMVKLSREGLQEVIDALDYQKGFIDDFKQSTQKRVSNLLQARYGTISELRENVYRDFRIDRDKTMRLFKREVEGFAKGVIDGSMDVNNFVENMQSSIGKYYERLYREGKGIVELGDWEKELLKGQVDGQKPYLNNFADYIRQKQALGQELTEKVTWRAGLYAERGSSMFEAGQTNAWPDDVLIDWVMQPAEHCSTCPIYQSNSPYTKQTLPGYPGEGFHLTRCGTNCNCLLRVSDLYVGELRGI